MNREEKRVAFIKTLVAAAWADGELDPNEIRTITEYLRRFEISAAEYDQLKPLLEQPLSEQQASELLRSQLSRLSSREERGAVVAAVEDLLLSNDRLAESEAAFLSQLRELTRHPTTPELFVSQLRSMWANAPAPSGSPEAETTEEPAATEPSEQFYRRRLLEYFRHTLSLARARAGLSVDSGIEDKDLYRVVIAAALLSAVAHADDEFCPSEEDQLVQLLRVDPSVPEPDVHLIVRSYREAALDQFDLGWLVREFLKIAQPEETGRLLDCLFLVAAADGELHEHELKVIREIAARLGFPETAFNSALSRCQARMKRGWN